MIVHYLKHDARGVSAVILGGALSERNEEPNNSGRVDV